MLQLINFDVRVPYPDDVLAQRVAENVARGLPEAQHEPDKPGVLNIIANGPSARLAVNAVPYGPTLALNNALSLGTPTYWAGCDPQPIMAQFVKNAPEGVTYFVASKCHADVFDALGGRDVRLWHVGDCHPEGVPTACSITLTAMSLFRKMGWRRFRTWGWDGCYLNGQDHAVSQPHGGKNITVIVGDEPFQTTTTWACEAQDAVNQLSFADYEVEVMGGGMIGAILKAKGLLANV